MRAPYSAVTPDLPLLAAATMASPLALCGVWLADAPSLQPLPVRLHAAGGWRTLLLGSDLGRLLALVDEALVDDGLGPVRLPASVLVVRRKVVHVREDEGPERTIIRYLG